MRISFVEIQNFRKLKSVRIDFDEKTTLLVGANNSGKTSAMVALGHFLVNEKRFTTNDFTLSNWAAINKIATQWESDAAKHGGQPPTLDSWAALLPSLDVWLSVELGQFHYVRTLIPLLDWKGGQLGVRLRFEPKDVQELRSEYLAARRAVADTKKAAAEKAGKDGSYTVALWPDNLRGFLERKLGESFSVRAYPLDPTKCQIPKNGFAAPQPLPTSSQPADGNPLTRLIKIDEIAAQRGLGDSAGNRAADNLGDGRLPPDTRKLSGQLRSYYSKHLAPSELPEPADLDALQAIETAQVAFDERLTLGFAAAITELESLNYPGITDPKLRIATQLHPTDGLNHDAAVQYQLVSDDGQTIAATLRLPEEYNGLGFQNLISMVFRLMSFRDAWMRVGKASVTLSSKGAKQDLLPPLHLVLVEEPEAHLHAQVQQVFVRKAYDVLRKHKDLGEQTALQTQLIVSTHSSHIAHECLFSCLRYFRRLPPVNAGDVPHSAVVNLSQVFGPNDATEKFTARYLRATHCDLFFADAAILVEGPAERMLIPHFIKKHFEALHRSFISILEIGGSHAHRLRPLIEALGLSTLIIADMDPVEPTGHHKATPPKRDCGLLSGNATLKEWHPAKQSLDELLGISDVDKVKAYELPMFSVRVAYQTPLIVQSAATGPKEALASTFEDSLVFENLAFFTEWADCEGMAKEFKSAITQDSEPSALGPALFEILRGGDKAALALELLWHDEPAKLKVPTYIADGLAWLEKHLTQHLVQSPGPGAPAAKTGGVQ